MLNIHERYLTDANGNRVAVVLDLTDFERLVSLAERAEEIPAPADPQLIAEALSLVGIGEDTRPLIDGKPVSEYPDLYLYGARESTGKQDKA